MTTHTQPSIARQFTLAIQNRRQPIKAGRIDRISIREITPTLAFIAGRTTAQWASGRRAVGRAVRNCRR